MAAAFALVMAVLPGVPDIPGEDGDKVQHMLAFFTLGILAAAGWRDRPAVLILAVLAAFGGFIEAVQAIPALHADAQWSDWMTDMAAAIVAITATRLVLKRT